MKKVVSLISLLAMLGVIAPVLAQDSQAPAPTPAPAVDCNTLKGKAKKDCKKAEKKEKKEKKGKKEEKGK